MRLCQFFLPGRGRRVGVVEGDEVIDVTSREGGAGSVLELIARRGSASRIERHVRQLRRRARSRIPWRDLDRSPSSRRPHLLAPLEPPEVWGAGITYRRSREYYEAHNREAGRTQGIYDHVYESDRPELFFKATASRTVGPNAPIGIRSDSGLTAVEAELAVVIDAAGKIVGYSAADDVSAWDIERENPLFLPQSKIFAGCFALGPVLVTPDEIGDPHDLELACTIRRGAAQLYHGRTSTGEMKRRCPELVAWLCRSGAVPPGTVLSTGTGILVPDECSLAGGDVVEIVLERVGTLTTPVRKLRS